MPKLSDPEGPLPLHIKRPDRTMTEETFDLRIDRYDWKTNRRFVLRRCLLGTEKRWRIRQGRACTSLVGRPTGHRDSASQVVRASAAKGRLM